MRIKDEDFKFVIEGKDYHCAMDVAATFVGGKWKTIVLWYLKNGKKRFTELKAMIPAITDKMLSLQLRSLESDGFVSRQVYPEIPTRVEYELTEEGKTLIPLLDAMADWGINKANRHGEMVKLENQK